MEMNIRDNWYRLGPATKQWLTQNPGCLILPRTVVARICSETGVTAEADRHGETTLSQEDREFLKTQVRARPVEAESRFFDATQP